MEHRAEHEEPRVVPEHITVSGEAEELLKAALLAGVDEEWVTIRGDEAGILAAATKPVPIKRVEPFAAFPGNMRTSEIVNYLGGRPKLLLEIGANDGDDTKRFIDAFPGCCVVAFEPDPRAIEKFLAHVDRKCVLVMAAVSDEVGETDLHMSAGAPGFHDPEWDKSSSICRPTRHLTRSPEITFPDDAAHRKAVKTLTLDYWWAQWCEHWEKENEKTIDFIWCDPQGSQAKIIRGGEEALKHTRWLYIEYYLDPLYEGEPTLNEIAAMLPNWELVATYEGENALFRNLEVQ